MTDLTLPQAQKSNVVPIRPGKIFKQMSIIMGEIGAIEKDRTNTSQNFKYRSIDDIYQGVQKLMAKHSVFCVPEIIGHNRTDKETASGKKAILSVYTVKYTFYADDSSSVTATVSGEGLDYGDKSGNKALSIAHKIALIQTFCIPTEQEDADATSHELARTPSLQEKFTNKGKK